jgi:signal transduction histidine kinase
MLERIRSYFAPAVPEDEEQARSAALLNTILLTALALSCVFMFLVPVVSPNPLFSWIITGSLLLPQVGALLLLRLGRVRSAGLLFSSALWVIITLSALFAGGVRSASFSVYTVIVLAAGLLLGWRVGSLFVGLSVLAGLGMLCAESHDLLPAPLIANTSLSLWTAQTSALVAAVALLYLVTRSILEALERARRHERAMAAANRELEAEIADREWAESALRQRERFLSLLSDITRTALETPNFPVMLQNVADRLADLFEADGSYLALWDEATGRPVPVAAYGEWRQNYSSVRVEPGERTVTYSVLRAARPLVIEDVYDTPYLSPRLARLFPDRSLLGLPLLAGDQKLGAVLIAFNEPHHFTPNEIARGEQAAAEISLAMANARLVEKLQEHVAELEAQNEELDAFAHTVAHDLQNPLSLIIGFAETLEKDYARLSSSELESYLRTIAQSSRRTGNIVDELLLLAGVRRMQVEIQPLEMAGIVAQALRRLADATEQHQAEVVLPEGWPVAMGYRPWVEEVWVNYLSNAIKYGGRPPLVELGAEVQPDGLVRFWVRDNGRGLTPEEQAQLFVPFTKLAQVRAGGHGLGLSIVRRIVGRLGGQVGAESDGVPGRGSLFFFTLPGVISQAGG